MKKWFIYVSDHHEGPFTVEEIRQGISEGKFQASGFVWAQGMPDWLPMGSVPDFAEAPAVPPPVAPKEITRSQQVDVSSLSVEPKAAESAPEVIQREETRSHSMIIPPSTAEGATPIAESAPEPVQEPKSAAAPAVSAAESFEPVQASASAFPSPAAEPSRPAIPIQEEKTVTTVIEVTRDVAKGIGAAPKIEENSGGQSLPPIEMDPAEKFSRMKPLVAIAAVVATLFALSFFGVFRPIEDRIRSALVKLPDLPDVSPEDREELLKAVKTPLSQGPAVALAVSLADPRFPSFYIGSNLPEGSRFEIHLIGVGSTLLNMLEFTGKTEVAVTRYLGKTPPFRESNGRMITRGEYRLFVVDATSGQPDATVVELSRFTAVPRNRLPDSISGEHRVVLEKKLFLGGPRDESYTKRLNEFHDQLKQKAQTELMELKQSVALIENQYSTTLTIFERLKKQTLGAAQIKAWRQMESGWSKLDTQLGNTLSKITPETMKKDYLYGEVFGLMGVVQKKLREIHGLQGVYFDKKASLAETEDQIFRITPEYEKLLNQLKTVIADIEAQPTDASGLPRQVTLSAKDGG